MKYLRGGELYSAKFIENNPELFTKSNVDLNEIMLTALKPVSIEEQKPIAPPMGGKVKKTRKLRRTKQRKSKRRK